MDTDAVIYALQHCPPINGGGRKLSRILRTEIRSHDPDEHILDILSRGSQEPNGDLHVLKDDFYYILYFFMQRNSNEGNTE